MKNVLAISICVACFSFSVRAQQNATPQLLKEPADWSFELFNLPPQFAPGSPFKGAEELKFYPAMFHKDSADYFSYAFVAQPDNTSAISQNDIQELSFNHAYN